MLDVIYYIYHICYIFHICYILYIYGNIVDGSLKQSSSRSGKNGWDSVYILKGCPDVF